MFPPFFVFTDAQATRELKKTQGVHRMLFFQGYTFQTILGAVAVLGGLILVNELTRRSKAASLLLFVIMPVILTIFVWMPKYGDPDSSAGTWFAWVKTYSALAGVVGFMAIRYFPKVASSKFALIFPGFILSFNILEAVAKDFQCYFKGLAMGGQPFVEGGLTVIGGPWNILNGIAGILCILSMTGWYGVKVAKTKSRDMIWADQLWFWIIAYDVWNMAYVYNCLSTRSFYAGFLLLLSCTIPSFVLKRGAWLQHRAQTLAMWGMVSLTFSYQASPYFRVTTTNDPAALMSLSVAALAVNIAVLVHVVYKAFKTKRNYFVQDLFPDLGAYKKVLAENGLDA